MMCPPTLYYEAVINNLREIDDTIFKINGNSFVDPLVHNDVTNLAI